MRHRLACFLVLSLLTLGGCGTSSVSTPTVDTQSPNSPQATPNSDTVSCVYNASGQAARPVDLPDGSNVEAQGTVTFVMHMDAGDVVLSMDRSNAPCAINSFESLAKQGFFDDTICHRLDPEFVLQCGDPTASSMGGPGYRYADELTGNETYSYGTLAMANSGEDTNGSQFFIVIGDSVGLPPSYTVLGSVTPESMTVIESIAAMGIDPTDPRGMKPLEGGHISSVVES